MRAASASRSLACDACRRRKIRCDRTHPCEKCIEACLACTYHAVPQRKGPKGRTAPVLTSLRNTFVSSAPQGGQASAPAPAAASTAPGVTTTLAATSGMNPVQVQAPSPSLNPMMVGVANPIGCETPVMMPQLPDHSMNSPVGEQIPLIWGDMPSPSPLPPPPPAMHRRVPSSVLLAHVDVFLKNLYPIMPVFDVNSVLLDCANPETLLPQRYAYLVGLCVATHYQLNLGCNHDLIQPGTPVSSGEELFAETMQTLRGFDQLEGANMDTVMTSFFLFMVYGNQNKQDHAWHYLSQSISFAVMLGLDREEAYATMHLLDAEMGRRIYWMLFVTER